MTWHYKRILLYLLILSSMILPLMTKTPCFAAPELEIESEAVVLMEASTGQIIYAQNETKELRPASITKIMTLLLIFEALADNSISMTDMVSVSEHAASMGGSQVFLEPYETQTVQTMIKCISIASANDASVAMAEHIAGSEEAFIAKMNARAKELGMEHTNFVNSYGLDEDGHYSCALDVALMSRALIVGHPQISEYATVWMDTFTHVTAKGETSFGLTNTNKLIKSYQGITGLKTGSTGLAKYCLSATAKREDMHLIAVVMSAPSTKIRFAEAAKLLNYGFANVSLYNAGPEIEEIPQIAVSRGVTDTISVKPASIFSYLCLQKEDKESISYSHTVPESVTAPIQAGDVIGETVYMLANKQIGSVALVACESVEKASYGFCFHKVLKAMFDL